MKWMTMKTMTTTTMTMNKQLSIKINKKHAVYASLNKQAFEDEIKKSFHLQKAVMDNIKIIDNHSNLNNDTMKEYIFLSTDWSDLFKQYENISEDEIFFYMHKCDIDGGISYKPIMINTKEGLFTMEIEQGKLENDFLFTTSFNPRIEKHIDDMLANNQIDYVNYDWKFHLTLE